MNAPTMPPKPGDAWTLPADAPIGYFDIELTPPPESVLPDGRKVGHHPCDCSVGDLDGDGAYELVVIWWPDAAADNSVTHYSYLYHFPLPLTVRKTEPSDYRLTH